MSRSPRKRGTRFNASLEREHPGLKIVGWYHTHPGFGVEFSEMDLFIQRIFLPGLRIWRWSRFR